MLVLSRLMCVSFASGLHALIFVVDSVLVLAVAVAVAVVVVVFLLMDLRCC